MADAVKPMIQTKTFISAQLEETIEQIRSIQVSPDRIDRLQPLIDYIIRKTDAHEAITLNFICTHNSRRSQFAQVWAQTFAYYFDLKITCLSSGTEVTEFNPRAIASLQRSGFQIESKGIINPIYSIRFCQTVPAIVAFSKHYDDVMNERGNFASVMTCAHADQNCPFIPGAEQRISIPYDDPKAFDETELEAAKYDETSLLIASELYHAFGKVAEAE